MNIEILKPELERRVREGIQGGRFQNVDELLTKALDALSDSSGSRSGALDWSKCPTVESVPGRVGGAWVFRDTRLPVSTIFENLEDGATVDEITEWFRDALSRIGECSIQQLDELLPHRWATARTQLSLIGLLVPR
jgi:uncharacterized protein (DUF433 family)